MDPFGIALLVLGSALVGFGVSLLARSHSDREFAEMVEEEVAYQRDLRRQADQEARFMAVCRGWTRDALRPVAEQLEGKAFEGSADKVVYLSSAEAEAVKKATRV